MVNTSRQAAVLVGTAACCALLAPTASAQPPASISVATELAYNITTLTVTGSATCDGGGTAGVDVDGSLEQMFPGGVGGPMAIRLDGPVLVDCDGNPHTWSGRLIAPGRALPANSGGSITVTLNQGPTEIATTGPRPVRIVR